jgi:hypothetical protein
MVVGGAMFGETEFKYRRIKWTPLTMPVSLARGTIRSPDFRVTRGETYYVESALPQEGSNDG